MEGTPARQQWPPELPAGHILLHTHCRRSGVPPSGPRELLPGVGMDRRWKNRWPPASPRRAPGWPRPGPPPPVRCSSPLPLGVCTPKWQIRRLVSPCPWPGRNPDNPPPCGNAHEIKGGLYPSVLPAGPVWAEKTMSAIWQSSSTPGKLAGALPLPAARNLRQSVLWSILLPLVGEGASK